MYNFVRPQCRDSPCFFSHTRHNIFSNILWIKSAGVIWYAKHRGTVVMICLEGSARYLEYDWVAGPGGFIYEDAGTNGHTLVSDHPNGVKLFGWLQGPLEFHDDTELVETGSMSGGSSITMVELLPRTRHSDQQTALHLNPVGIEQPELKSSRCVLPQTSVGWPTLLLPDRATGLGGKGGSLGELTARRISPCHLVSS